MAKECKNCVHKSDFKSAECGVCMVSYYDGEQIGLPSNFEQKPKTNADRIRAMSDEELAAYWVNCSRICDWCSRKEKCDMETATQVQCVTGVLEWLKQPAEVDGNA